MDPEIKSQSEILEELQKRALLLIHDIKYNAPFTIEEYQAIEVKLTAVINELSSKRAKIIIDQI